MRRGRKVFVQRRSLRRSEEDMAMKIYGHPWSIDTRKTLMTLAERGHEGRLANGDDRELSHAITDLRFALVAGFLAEQGASERRLDREHMDGALG